jgi:protein-S-isoprenylcysteine O-methyltransferase Ste14
MIHLERTEDLSKKNEWFLRIKGILIGTIPVIIMGAILFIPAGTLNWPMAWIILGVQFAAIIFVTLLCNPDLIVERMNRQSGAKDWDTRLVRVMNLSGFLTLLVAGLDMRFGWSVEIPVFIPIAALCIFFLSYCLFTWSMLNNPFFSLIVRIQSEKDHHVITSGPYHFVRHPGYLGFFLIVLTQPLMLGSLWALIPAVITGVLFIVRASREDDTLLTELKGYREYTQKVRFRMFPGIW